MILVHTALKDQIEIAIGFKLISQECLGGGGGSRAPPLQIPDTHLAIRLDDYTHL